MALANTSYCRIRECSRASLNSFVNLVHEHIPAVRSCCDLAHRALESPYPATLIERISGTQPENPFEQRVHAVIMKGPLACFSLEESDDEGYVAGGGSATDKTDDEQPETSHVTDSAKVCWLRCSLGSRILAH